MSRIIYQSPRGNQEYLIDEDAQQLLAYLYLFGSAHPKELAGPLNYKTGEDIVESVDNVLCKNKAGLVVVRYTDQLTLKDDQVPEISLTNDGKSFVDRYKSEIPVPFSVHDYIQEMEKIESGIEECLTGVEDRLGFYDESGATRQELDEMMTRLEEYFDEVRDKRL
jgi:hypothetical protein